MDTDRARAVLASMNEWLGNSEGLMIEDVVAWRDDLEAALAAVPASSPDYEGDLPTAHPNRCRLRDTLVYADLFNEDGSHRAVWRCHKRAGHDGPCSSHNDCGVMNGGVVCGKRPGHAGPHEWATEITVRASSPEGDA